MPSNHAIPGTARRHRRARRHHIGGLTALALAMVALGALLVAAERGQPSRRRSSAR